MSLHDSAELDRLAHELSNSVAKYASTYANVKRIDELRSQRSDTELEGQYAGLHDECGKIRTEIKNILAKMQSHANALFG